MEIRKTNIHFGARTLYPMNLKKIVGNKSKLLKANFAELSVISRKDNHLIYNLLESWRVTNRSNNYISDIKSKFDEDAFFLKDICKYFITRFSGGKGKMVNKTAAIAVVKMKTPELLSLEYIQSAPVKLQKVIGGGACTLLGIVKYANEHGFKKIELVSVADKFYEHMGFLKIPIDKSKKIIDQPTYFLPCDRFNDFIKNVETKYKIS